MCTDVHVLSGQAGPSARVPLGSFPCPSNHGSRIVLQPSPPLPGWATTHSAGQRLLSCWRLRGLCLVHVMPAGARPPETCSALVHGPAWRWPQPGWDTRSSERLRSVTPGRGADQLGNLKTGEQWASWSSWEKLWAFLHCRLERGGPRWLLGSPLGDPGVLGSSWTTEKGKTPELAPGSRQLKCQPLALPQLLVSPDGVPHGHGPAQRGQHLVPVRGAHAAR